MKSPMYGAFCAWSIATEDSWTADTLGPSADPNFWYISYHGRLYVFKR